jgi:hypothetical protein
MERSTMNLLTTRLAASALSFSHLASLGRGKQAKADDKDKDYRDKDDDKEASARAEDDDEDKDKNNTGDDDSKAKADEPGAEDDDEDNEKKEPGSKGKKSKRAKAEDDDEDEQASAEKDDDDEDELHGKNAIARARLREQARCAAIMGCRAAGRNVPLAAQLALTTRMTREEAIGVLQSTPAAVPIGSGRELRNPKLGGGGERAMDSTAQVAASWDRAFQMAGAVRRK